MDMIEQTFVT